MELIDQESVYEALTQVTTSQRSSSLVVKEDKQVDGAGDTLLLEAGGWGYRV